MVQVQKLTAETLLGAPRRGVAVPNHNGTLALYTLSTHNFDDGKTRKEVRVADLTSDGVPSRQLSDDDKVHDAVWIPGTNNVVYLKSGDKGATKAFVANAGHVDAEHYVVGEFDAPIANLKLKRLDDGGVVFVVTGLVGPNGELYNEEAVEKRSTARVFDTAQIRVWNSLYKEQRYSLWYNKLQLDDGRWSLAGSLLNLLADEPDLEAPAGMYDVAEPLSNFDISHRGVAFFARDLTRRRPDEGIVTLPFFVPVDSFTLPPVSKPKPIEMPPDVRPCIGGNMRFSPDGASNVMFLYSQPGDLYANRLYLASTGSLAAFDVFALVTRTSGASSEHGGGGDSDEDHDPPGAFEFAGSADALVLESQKCGRTVLSTLKLQDGERPRFVFREGSVAGFHPLREGCWDKLLVSSSNFVDSSTWQVVDISASFTRDSSSEAAAESGAVHVISSATKNGAKFGISHDMVSEFWYEGAQGVCLHSFMLRPADFDETKKYPWVLMPHGGPVSAWSDAWNTRWNMAAWAEQGYVIVCPNITGSTGYGLELARGINGQWGGRAFEDLVNLIAHIEKLPYLDQDKAVLAGASYGGYMVSWFFGQEIINKFCCAVWHDGIHNLPSFFLQNDVIFDDGSFDGPIYYWQDPAAFERFNPGRAELLRNWGRAPPTIIIHSDKDYRCPVTEGLAAMNTLQAHGVPTRFLTFSDECHWVLNAENSRVWHNEVWGWVRRCVDGEVKRGDTTW
ncbi:hypothetical protein PLICBS_003755 [Purpureocillium lilacinum]|uniref:uncharacterized protein n=1 Tax=Purpureocillium lilacinum TaxID=33203 RepID=UPI00208AAAAB|nr:hypothetical protein PLICBS_003755 [Purpureocillium lilacinum]